MKTTKEKSMKAGRAPVPLELEDMPLPMNTFKNKAPFTGTVKSVERIVGPNATGETCHIIIEHGGKMPFWEGQSYGVIPPGTKVNSKGKEVPHGVRLYSIASSRYGDSFDGKTATLCVRRATYWDEEMGAEDPAKKGICSNFLCDAQPGTEIMMTGPTGQVMLLPKDPSTPVIMVATGTGIAPMRAYIRRFFVEDIPSWNFTGLGGCSWASPTLTPLCTMTNSKSASNDSRANSESTTPYPENKTTRRVARCISKIRLRNTRTKSSACSMVVRTCTSAV